MKTGSLRILSSTIVFESNLSKQAKLQILNFIREASTLQLKVLLLDGEIISNNIDETTKQIIEDRFIVFEADPRWTPERKEMMSMLGFAVPWIIVGIKALVVGQIGIPLGWFAYRAIRSIFSECSRKCKPFGINTRKRQSCMKLCRLQVIESTEKMLKKVDCNAEVDPKGCIEARKLSLQKLKKEREGIKKEVDIILKQMKSRGEERLDPK